EGAAITICDERDRVCARISGYVGRPPKDKPAKDNLGEICFTPEWVHRSVSALPAHVPGPVCLITGASGLLETAFQSLHPDCVEIQLSQNSSQFNPEKRELDVNDPEAWNELCRRLPRPAAIYFFAGKAEGQTELERTKEGQTRGVLTLFHLVKALQRAHWW